MVYKLKFDGCCNPNPGEMGLGTVAWNDSGEKVFELSEKAGFGTNNQAEYNALIKGLEELAKSYSGELLVQGDSQLVINQLKGEWKVKKEELIPLFEKAKELENKFEKVEYKWVPRDDNTDADELSAKAVGLKTEHRKDKKVMLEHGKAFEFVFDSDDRIALVRDENYNRDVNRYYVREAYREGKRTSGNHFETGANKLIGLLDYHKPLEGKRLKIIPIRLRAWTDSMVEEIEDR
jgi:ribonuclease HI